MSAGTQARRVRPADEGLTAPLLTDDFYASDPFDHYARLREAGPLLWHDDPGVWIVSHHAEVMEVVAHPARFCSSDGVMVEEIGVTYDAPPTIMHTDPPEHTRYRKLVQPAFRPAVIRGLEATVRARIVDLLDAEVTPGTPLDVVEAIAVPFPIQVIGDLLGIPEEVWPRFFIWSEAVVPGSGVEGEERQRLQLEMVEYLLSETAQRREQGEGPGVIADLATAEVDGRQLTDDEIVMFLVQLLVAGNETTRNVISGGLVAFADHPDQWERLRADRTLIPGAVEEMVRFTSPVTSFMRTATADTHVGEQPVAAGDPLLLLYASANRDEQVFGPTAGTFDVGRDPNPHVAFGHGPHFCIGAALARLEVRVLLEELLDRVTTIARAGEVRWAPSSVLSGLKEAPLVFAAAAAPAAVT